MALCVLSETPACRIDWRVGREPRHTEPSSERGSVAQNSGPEQKTPVVFQVCMMRTNHKNWKICWVCRMAAPPEDHHVQPKAENGDDSAANKLPLCESCHMRVTHGFKDSIFFADVLNKLNDSTCPIFSRLLFLKLVEFSTPHTPEIKRSFDAWNVFNEERRKHSERVEIGMAKAKAKGIKLGRKTVQVDTTEIQRLRAEKVSFEEIAERLGISVGTCFRAAKRAGL